MEGKGSIAISEGGSRVTWTVRDAVERETHCVSVLDDSVLVECLETGDLIEFSRPPGAPGYGFIKDCADVALVAQPEARRQLRLSPCPIMVAGARAAAELAVAAMRKVEVVSKWACAGSEEAA